MSSAATIGAFVPAMIICFALSLSSANALGGRACQRIHCSRLMTVVGQLGASSESERFEFDSGFISTDFTDRGGDTERKGWRRFPLDKVVIPMIQFSKQDFRIHPKEDLRPVVSPFKPSPVEMVSIRGKKVYIKRDDLLRLQDSNVSGNKARKLFALNQIPATDFPACVVSYGGSQSNAMLALAAIVQSKNTILLNQVKGGEAWTSDEGLNTRMQTGFPEKRFVYFSKTVSRFLRKNPSGNYFRAKSLGMELVEFSNDKYIHLFGGASGGSQEPPSRLDPPVPGDSIWIPQGGASGVAVPGGRLLAIEIVTFWDLHGNGRPLTIFVPGGTCSTALILHREIRRIQSSNVATNSMDIKVVVIPCVGDEGYAERQMMALNMASGGLGSTEEVPVVLKPAPDETFYLEEPGEYSYFRFGEPDGEILETFREMDESGVKLDLLYGAPSWNLLLRHWPGDSVSDEGASSLLSGREILYLHSGGLEGINSQLMRYRHKGLIEGDQVQHPERQRRSSREFLDSVQE